MMMSYSFTRAKAELKNETDPFRRKVTGDGGGVIGVTINVLSLW